ncbi:hypothetical protein BH11PSE6_BH11PSE6_11050 [soil metagenome]
MDVHPARFVGLPDTFKITVDQSFFDHPSSNAVVGAFEPVALTWLSAIGFASVDAQNISARVRTVVARSLHDEWRSNREYYGELAAAIASPFASAAGMELDWDNYRSYLISLAGEQVFDETFSLEQIYIEPRCFHTVSKRSESVPQLFAQGDIGPDEQLRIAKFLGEEINSWIASPDKELSVRIIAGGPGAGKSSYAKLLSARLAEGGRNVVFIPLHQIDLESGIAPAIGHYLKDVGHFTNNPLEQIDESSPLILVLDGLDEIQMQGRAAQDAASGMVSDLLRWIDRKNSLALRIKCIITGRELAVQSTESLFKGDGQILHILPYFLTAHDRRTYVDANSILAVDQRDEWWSRYGALSGKGYDGIPPFLASGEIGEVTAQPLLNYLVALAHGRGLAIDEGTNINEVYESLLRAVYERSWAKNTHPSIRDVTYDSFVRLLEEVSLSVWHGAGRTTTLQEVEEHCRQSRVSALLTSFGDGSGAGVSSLLLAFYFRQKGRRSSGEKTFEFTHKTFAEYLTSSAIIRSVDAISKKIEEFLDDPDNGINEEAALHRWLILCGPTAIDSYLHDFIRREVRFRGKDKAEQWQQALSRMLSYALRASWPIHHITGLNFTEQTKRVRNAEEALLACLNACARVTLNISEIGWPNETSFGSMLVRLQGQRSGPTNLVAMKCLSFLDLTGQAFDIADLYAANLRSTKMVGAEMNYSMLVQADLSYADLTGAAMTGSNISSAKLRGTRVTLYQIVNFREHDRGMRIVDSEIGRGKADLRRFRATLLDLLKRGAIIVDLQGKALDAAEATEMFKQEKDYFAPLGRRYLAENKLPQSIAARESETGTAA